MQHPVKHLLYFCTLVCCLGFDGSSYGQTSKKYCDSLITLGSAKMREGEYLVSLELLNEAHSLAQKNNWEKQLIESKNMIGSDYLSLFDHGKALKYYMAAYAIAVKTKNVAYEAKLLGNISILYSKENKYEKSTDYFKRAYDLFKKEKDINSIGIYSLNLGIVYNEMEKYTQARTYLDESQQCFRNNPEMLLMANTAIAINEMGKGNSANAILLSKNLLSRIKKWRGNDTAITLLLVISESYFNQKDYQKSREYANMAYKNNTNLRTKINIFSALCEINGFTGNYTESLAFKDSIMDVKDKLNEISNGRVYENNRVKFEMQEYKNQISLNKTTISSERKMFYVVLIALLLITVLIIMIMRNLSIKHRQKKLLAENNEQIVTLELEKEKSENLLLEKQFREEQTGALLEQERLKNEIEHKNRKLSVNALYLSRKNEIIDEMLKILSNLPEASKDQTVKNHISFLRKDLRTDNEWESFISHFEEVNQGFLARLKSKHMDLTVNDIRFICYVFMNLSSKEIASMLSITLDACRKRKERVANRLGLSESGNLYAYLSAI